MNQMFSPAAEAIQQPSNPTQVGMSVCSPPQVGMSLCSPPPVFRVKFIQGSLSWLPEQVSKETNTSTGLVHTNRGMVTVHTCRCTSATGSVDKYLLSLPFVLCETQVAIGFTPSQLVVDEFVVSRLGEVHKQHLFEQFHLTLERFHCFV